LSCASIQSTAARLLGALPPIAERGQAFDRCLVVLEIEPADHRFHRIRRGGFRRGRGGLRERW